MLDRAVKYIEMIGGVDGGTSKEVGLELIESRALKCIKKKFRRNRTWQIELSVLKRENSGTNLTDWWIFLYMRKSHTYKGQTKRRQSRAEFETTH